MAGLVGSQEWQGRVDAGAAGRKILTQGRRDRRRDLGRHELAQHELTLGTPL